MKRWIATLLTVTITIVLVGCANTDEETLIDDEQTAEAQDHTGVQADELRFVTPFTGEAVAEEVTQRPILVTINNHPDARPQSGITSADVVYEMLAEGEITRLLALYQSTLPENIGPVRSARSYFVEIAKGLDAFYIAHGYSPEAQTMLKNNIVDNINGMEYDGSLFKRASHRVAPHNSYISSENILAGAEKVNASTLYNKKVSYAFYDDQESVKIGLVANNIAVEYGSASFNSTYTYDATEKMYARASAGEATTDELTGDQVKVSNILFFEMPHQVVDDKGRREININNGGKAYVAQNGTIREVAWENQEGLLVAVEQDGTNVLLVPGKTWIHFIPTSPGLAAAVTYTE